jgi:hypothetical protein
LEDRALRKFVFIFGPQAVGKMTVGQELAKITGLKLFHNHMTIDLLEPLYGFTPEMWRLANLFRNEIFESFAKSDQYGLIFTKVWFFNKKEDWHFVENMCNIFRKYGVDIYFVELEADVEERLLRNKTPHRLKHKPTKRNVEQSEQHLLSTLQTDRMNSFDGEITEKNYIRINNTNLSPFEVAQKIIREFLL